MEDKLDSPVPPNGDQKSARTAGFLLEVLKRAEETGSLECFGIKRNPTATPVASPAAQAPAPAEKPTPPHLRTYRRLDSELTPKQRRARQRRAEWLKKVLGPIRTFDLPAGPQPSPVRNVEGGSNV